MRTLDSVGVLSARDIELLRQVKAAIQRRLPAATVLLYGSVARGTHRPDSDYDILVLTDVPLAYGEKDAVRDEVFEVELECGSVISALFYAKSDWDTPLYQAMPLHEEVDRDAIVL
jgi:predicted nucleotidyltransferase